MIYGGATENDYSTTQTALSFIDPDDRETWWRTGAAIKSGFGEDGLEMWLSWSKQSQRFDHRAAMASWRSFRQVNRITMGTLYAFARQGGWQPSISNPPVVFRPAVDLEKRRRESEAEVRRAGSAAQIARQWINEAELAPHPYLSRKGLYWDPGHYIKDRDAHVGGHGVRGLVRNGLLLVPMQRLDSLEVRAVQVIDDDGGKKFQPTGCRVAGTAFALGAPPRSAQYHWYCEGYATAWSVYLALTELFPQQKHSVIVMFSAMNLARHAQRGFVIADNDESGTGEKCAQRSGLPFWMPPDVGTDANDFHVKYGLDELKWELQDFWIGQTRSK